MSLPSFPSRIPIRTLLLASTLLLAAAPAQAQPTFSKVFAPSTIGPGSVSTATFTINNGSGTPVINMSFTDVLPAAVTIADPANASTTCTFGGSGSLSAPDGGSTITLTDAQVGIFSSCTVKVDVTSSTPGMHTNPAITLNTSAGSSMSLAVDLTVATDRPGFTKSFASGAVALGERTTLTFTVDNSLNASAALALAFSDDFPTGLEIADPANVVDTCNDSSTGVFSAVPGTDSFSYSNGSVGAGATCTIGVDVLASGVGMLDNVTGELTSVFGFSTLSSGKASDTLAASVTPLAITKSFTDDPVPPGMDATLEFTITNFDRFDSATDVEFTDDLTTLVPPLAGLVFDSELFNDCGPSVSGLGTTTLGFSGGTLPAEGVCTIRVTLSVPSGATPGAYSNTTSAVTADVGGSPVVGNMASDDLFVDPIPVFTKEFIDDPTTGGGTVTLRFTITNTDSANPLTGIEFTDDIGGTGSGRSGALPGLAANGLVAAGGLEPEPLVDPCGAGSELTIPDDNDSLPSPPFPAFPPDPTLLEFSGGNLAEAGMPGDSCTFDVVLDVPIGTPSGAYPNTTSDLTATPTGTSPAIDDLIIVAAPPLDKEFSDDPVAPGGTVTLQFTLSHPAEATSDATDITFTDDLNAMGIAGLVVNLPPSPDPPCGMGSSLTASGNVLTLADGFLQPGEDCTFSVTLDIPMATVPDNYSNTTSDVSATVQGLAVTSAANSDVLVVSGLSFTKEFLDDPVIAGDSVTLRFTIANIHPTENATGISFSDNLAAVLPGVPDLVATLPPAADSCGGTMSGTTSLSYSGGAVTSGSSCTIDLDVLVPAGTADGTYNNVTSILSATQGGAVAVDPANDFLEVDSNRIQLTKSFTDDPVAAGDPVTLEFVLTNLDVGQAASNIDFNDDLGAALVGLTFDSEQFNDCSATVTGTGTDMVTVMGASLGAGASCTIRISLTVPGGAADGVFLNTTSDVTGTIGGLAVTGDAASDELNVVPLLEFSKTFDGPTTATGAATLTFTITNPGSDTATDVEFSDNLNAVIPGLIATALPAVPCGAGSSISGISLLTFEGGELAGMGGTCSFDVDVLVPGTAAAGTYPNVTSELFRNGLVVSGPATADLVIEPPPDFDKVFDPDHIFADGVSTLRFTLDNSASAFAADDLAFVDNLPAGVVVASPPASANSCGGSLTAVAGTSTIELTGGSVGAGATCAIDVNVTSIVSGPHANTTGDLTSTSGNSGTASDTLNVTPTADLSVTKTDGVTTATPGGSVTYTIVVSNNGPSADPSVGLADAFPSPPLTCTYTSVAAGGATGNTAAGAGDLSETLSMPAGSSVTYTATCAIDSDATGTLSNTATVTPSVNDMVPANNSATDDDTVLVPEADLAITKTDGVTTAIPGQTMLTYTIVAANAGLSDDPSVSVADTFPAVLSCTFTSVAAGGASGNTAAGAGDLSETLSLPTGSSVTYTVSCTIDPAAAGTLSNTATISGSVDDPDSGNNSATDDDTVLAPEADLSVTKTDGVTSAVPGQDTLTYTIVVANGGPSVDPAASLADVFPASLTCTYTSVAAGGATGNTAAGAGDLAETLSLPVGGSVTYTVGCTIDPAATGTLSNTATATASVTDPVPGNNSATDGDTVLTPEADLAIDKSTDVTLVAVGDTIDYDLEVSNNGPSTATGILLDDPTPTGLVFQTADAPCGGGFPCELSDLAPAGSVTITASFMVPFDYAGPAQITNTATVSADTTDGNAGNDSDMVLTDVEFDVDPPAVTAITTVNGPLAVCDDLRLPVSTISVSIEDTNSPIVGADSPANYLLVGSGPDGDFATASCAGGVSGDDEAEVISGVSVDDSDPLAVTATVSVAGPQGLAAGLYRFFVCGTIADEAGNLLDGGDFEVSFFRANPGNLFANGHFDDCPSTLDPWTPSATPPNAVQTGIAGTDDFEGSPLSASAHFVQTDPASSSLEQCVPVVAESFYDLEAWLRYDAPLGALAVYEQVCEFFDSAGCGGTSLGQASLASLLEDVGTVWNLSEFSFATPPAAASASCRFETGPLGSDPLFNLYVDGLFLGGIVDPEIFSDGFESGDTSAWSLTVP